MPEVTGGRAESRERRGKKRNRLRMIFGIVTLASFLLSGGLAVYLLFPDVFERQTEVTVPDLTGKVYDRAEIHGPYEVIELLEYDDSPVGTVLSQRPVAGTRRTVGKGRQVTLLLSVSRGPRQAEVPDVGGMTAGEAEAALLRAGFRVERHNVYDRHPAGTVLSQEPAGGSVCKVGRTVTLRVSRGSWYIWGKLLSRSFPQTLFKNF